MTRRTQSGRKNRTTIESKTPPSAVVIRRRTALLKAGLEHGALAEAIQKMDGIPTSRQAVTSVVNGHFGSMRGRVEKRIVELTRARLVELGEVQEAKRVTLKAFGWGHIEDSPTDARDPGEAQTVNG